ncbi:MAG: hypothetical protein GW875_03975 [Deltaproteobacteria bacterium]|nr:hypothetical protein [Deltaproteobacteria bacterium]NCP03817.1 hypothetical protein [Deltaproteobacteria bacterium]
MIITCPECQKKLRFNAAKYTGRRLTLNCRHCGGAFSYLVPRQQKILVAHGEPEVCQMILTVCRHDVAEMLVCSEAEMLRTLLRRHRFAALLLDVALPGAFSFELIDEIHADGAETKIILLPSVYNRTAYKRKPTSLYHADAYLELHHLSDQLIPLLRSLVPGLSLQSSPYCLLSDRGEERHLSELGSVSQQAEALAAQLIADIALYYQDQIDLGIEKGDLETRLAVQLDEGQRLLTRRIPRAELDARDYLTIALKRFIRAREKELENRNRMQHD